MLGARIVETSVTVPVIRMMAIMELNTVCREYFCGSDADKWMDEGVQSTYAVDDSDAYEWVLSAHGYWASGRAHPVWL